MIALFSLTLFVSAFLLFWVQLMVAKLLLPLLGGVPSVWNTCLCFFQALLLLGYGYAHLISQRLSVRLQTGLQGLLLLLPLPLLPIALAEIGQPPETMPTVLWLLALLGLTVGLPFFVVATSAPLLQQWLAKTNHPDRDDPYFLYAASNLGSLLGLVCYPLLIEPRLTLSQQSQGWAIAYLGLVSLILVCGGMVWRTARSEAPAAETAETTKEMQAEKPLSWQQQGRWLGLALVPSSLLLGVTTYLTTDIAAMPLLWALPLGLYLLTFIPAFSRHSWPEQRLVALLPLLLTPLVLLFLLKITRPSALLLPLHLLGFTLTAYVFHRQLAQTRPAASQLTRFYLWVALGGVLGGLLNAIAAPLVFSTVLEYPLVLVWSLLLLPQPTSSSRLRLTLPLSLGLLIGGLLIGLDGRQFLTQLPSLGFALGLWAAIAFVFGLGWGRQLLGLSLIVMLNQFSISSLGGVLATERSFFGVYQVLQDQRQEFNTLVHGTTVHGRQSLQPDRRQEPLTYFSRTGPIGQLFEVLQPAGRLQRVAVLGLGVGTLAAYAEPGQVWTFYEIDPLVVQLARNPEFFSFLQDARVTPQIVLGDGRLQLAQASDRHYDLIIMDAFSSDAIPLHLITREALQLYLQKLSDRGLLVVNITNRYLDLEPVFAALAQDLGLTVLHQYDRQIGATELAAGKTSSHWLVLARQPQDLALLDQDQRWQAIAPTPSFPVWTDNYSNIFQTIRRP